MKICFIYEDTPGKFGGALVLFGRITKELIRRGHKVCLISNPIPEDIIATYFEQAEVYQARISSGKGVTSSSTILGTAIKRAIEVIKSRHEVYRIVESFRPDIVCVPTEYPAILAMLIKRKYKIPAVYYKAHNHINQWHYFAPFPQRLVFNFIEKSTLRLPFDAYIGNSATSHIFQKIRFKLNRAQFTVTTPVIESHLFQYSKDILPLRKSLGLENKKVILYVGSLQKVKGIEYAIDAMKFLAKETYYQLLIVGGGDEEYNLKQRVKDYRLGGCITFTGHRPASEIPDYVLASGVVLVPSLSETFGSHVMHYAWALRRPVIVTAVGDVPRMAKDRQTALFIPPKSAEAIVEKVNEIFSNPLLRANLVENAYHEAKKYSVEQAADTFERAFEGIIKGRS